MDIVELILNDDNEGIEAISIVESPAIEIDFIALKKQEEVKFKTIDEEKRLLMGAILVPDKPIYRKNGDQEYYIYFTKDTVRKSAQMYLKKGFQHQSTLEHTEDKLKGITLVESWIVEDSEKDKSAFYGFSVPVGTWFGAMRIDNDDIWNDYVKTGKVKGFSIEGFFSQKENKEVEEEKEAEEALSKISYMIDRAKKKVYTRKLCGQKVN